LGVILIALDDGFKKAAAQLGEILELLVWPKRAT
jgi:hypothetical protein